MDKICVKEMEEEIKNLEDNQIQRSFKHCLLSF